MRDTFYAGLGILLSIICLPIIWFITVWWVQCYQGTNCFEIGIDLEMIGRFFMAIITFIVSLMCYARFIFFPIMEKLLP